MRKILIGIFSISFFVGGFLSFISPVKADILEEGCLSNQNYSSTTGQRCGCSHNETYSSTTGMLCVIDNEVTGFLTEVGPSNTMWGTHRIINDDYAVCVAAPCPSANHSYLVSAKDSSSVLNDLHRYENSKVKITGRLQWYDLEGGFWGFIATDVTPISTTEETIKVISPNGGETIRIGQKYSIEWDSEILNGPKVSISLEDESINCPAGIVGCWSSFIFDGWIQNNRSYLWDTSKNLFGPGGPNSYTIRPGVKYKIKICSAISDNICDESNNYFSIISSQSNAPVISEISGPQSLNVNQTGTWKVTASDTNNGNLSYSVNWGDNIYREVTSIALPPEQIGQQATFTHTYTTAGIYNPIFTVTNSDGVRTETSLSVRVGNSFSQMFERTLKMGYRGEDVKILQSMLGIKPDGSYGQITKAKVVEWQMTNGLIPDGIFGPASRQVANTSGL